VAYLSAFHEDNRSRATQLLRVSTSVYQDTLVTHHTHMIVPKPLYRYTRPLYSRLPYVVSSPIISSSRPPRILPANVLVEEERVPGYRPEFCYPENPGEVLNNCYKILTKVGWGTASTVWLAEDLERYEFSLVPKSSANP
jgi:hypothetical protein